MRPFLGLSLSAIVIACSTTPSPPGDAHSTNSLAPPEQPTSEAAPAANTSDETKPQETDISTSKSSWDLQETYSERLTTSPATYDQLQQSLRPAAPAHRPSFSVASARHYRLLNERMKLSKAQRARLERSGFITLSLEQLQRKFNMAELYLKIWQAELPVLITTDSILHAWHRTYDDTLMKFETSEAIPAYRSFLQGLRLSLQQLYPSLSPELRASAQDLDVYIAVGLTLIGPELTDKQRWELRRSGKKSPRSVVEPLHAPRKLVSGVLGAIDSQMQQSIWLHGGSRLVDFSQFKVRGHYTKSEDLKRYFRAAMWMGRADTGFPVVDSRGAVKPRGARAALLFAHLARLSGGIEAFDEVQRSIDYFVGSENGLSIASAVEFLEEQGMNGPSELADDGRMKDLAIALAARGPEDRVTSQGILPHRMKEPPPLVFQVASQRFTLDSFVHDRFSYDEVAGRTMVTAPEVFAAFGNDEATRLLEPEIERYGMAREVSAMRSTVDALPDAYWEQNVYTRWFDALRTLHDVPDSQHFPRLFEGRAWQRKQLSTQLASFAELRRDTILYVAQTYSDILCDFPAVYVEPYPEFFDKMEKMARSAATHFDDPKFFERFAGIMQRLKAAARAQLVGKSLPKDDAEFLKSLVKRNVSGGGCGPPTASWSGWYSQLFSDGEVSLWEPVIADVFTDPNTRTALNVATASPELAIIAIETQGGPSLFVGPVSSYREFTGGRMSDEEWQGRLKAGAAPAAPSWTKEFRAGSTAPPRPHERRGGDPSRSQPFY